jgi:hypothetical protein
MDAMLLEIFRSEIERQCKIAVMAFQDLEKALHAYDMDRVWFSIQGFLVAVGMVSKLLWPANSSSSERGLELRKAFAVSNDSRLSPRTFRNHFEHFDERLETWANSSDRHNFLDANLGSLDRIAGIDQVDFLRNFDPASFVLTYQGDSYHLRPVVEAIGDLWKRVKS